MYLQESEKGRKNKTGLNYGTDKMFQALAQNFYWKIEIGLYLTHCNTVSELNIDLFQFSSKISVTLVFMLFTPPLVNPIYQQLSR